MQETSNKDLFLTHLSKDYIQSTPLKLCHQSINLETLPDDKLYALAPGS